MTQTQIRKQTLISNSHLSKRLDAFEKWIACKRLLVLSIGQLLELLLHLFGAQIPTCNRRLPLQQHLLEQLRPLGNLLLGALHLILVKLSRKVFEFIRLALGHLHYLIGKADELGNVNAERLVTDTF